MNVLIYTPIYSPYSGGACVYFSTLVDNLSNQTSISVLTSTHPDKDFITTENGRQIYRIIPRPRRLPRLVRACIQIPFILLVFIFIIYKNKIDIVHAHPTSVGSVGIAFGAMLTSTSILYDCRDKDFPTWLIKLGPTEYWGSCAKNIDKRLADSGIPIERIVHFPVINPSYVSEYERKDTNNTFKLIFVGALTENKGVHILIDAFEQLTDQYEDIELTVVGDGPLGERIAKRINRSGLSSVSLLGSISHRRTLELMTRADVLVLPSSTEGTPRVILEATEIGLPCIATAVGDVPEYIYDGETGFIVERSADRLVQSIGQLHDDTSLQKHFSENCRQKVITPESESIAKHIEQTYQKIMDNEC